MTSILICTPCYTNKITLTTAATVVRLLRESYQRGVRIELFFSCGDAVNRQRNRCVAKFLSEPQHTHLLWLDDDIGCQPATIWRWLELNEPLICANYPRKMLRFDKLADGRAKRYNDMLQGTVTPWPVERGVEPDGRGMLDVRFGGTGLMLVRRHVFEELVDAGRVPKLNFGLGEAALVPHHYRFFAFQLTEDGDDMGEDYAFCQLVRESGHKIWCDVQAHTSHAGEFVYAGLPSIVQPELEAEAT